jgi:phospholipase C
MASAGNDTSDLNSLASTSRRRLLKASAGAAALALLPPSVRLALAQAPEREGSIKDIEHIVVLIQENRSFDHYFGTLSGVRGFADENALKLASGRSVFYQPDAQNPDGYLLPFHLDTQTTGAQKIPSTGHSWQTQHDACNDGKMDNWIAAHRKADGVNGPFTMGYYTRADIPFHFALADAFTVCDAYHSSLLGPTWPNRMYVMTGTIDADGAAGGPITANRRIAGGFRWTTYPERLEKAGVSWKVYQQEDNYGTNVLEYFQQFQNLPATSPLSIRGLTRAPEGTFEDDARAGRLPTISWILPTSTQSEHPDFTPAAGADFIAQKIEAIASNPAVWAKTAFILAYDENDGLFDHVAPPMPPLGTPGEFVGGAPIGAGFRVPCIIVSPWTAGGYVCSQRFDHTSILQFMERVTDVREDNISAWRRQTFGDLTAAFRFSEKAQRVSGLPDAKGVLLASLEQVSQLPRPAPPSGVQNMPMQESGSRKTV